MDSPQSEAKRKDLPATIEEGSVRPPPERSLFPIVGIGASAGGLEALRQLLPNLPRDTGLGFVVVQHLRPHHQSMLPELLSRATTIPVFEAKEGMRVESDHIYVTPPNAEITIRNGVLSLKARHDTPQFHLPIDGFFTSLAEDRKEKALGVVLSGTASDGTLGLKAIKAQGGITFAQEEQSAKFGGMPHSAIYAGHVDFVLPPEGIARELGRIGQHLNGSIGKEPAPEDLLRGSAGDLNQILALLRNETGVDFREYKKSTIGRRIRRRMVVNNIDTLADYMRYAQGNRKELDALYQDVLIYVTSFFREIATFETISRSLAPTSTRRCCKRLGAESIRKRNSPTFRPRG